MAETDEHRRSPRRFNRASTRKFTGLNPQGRLEVDDLTDMTRTSGSRPKRCHTIGAGRGPAGMTVASPGSSRTWGLSRPAPCPGRIRDRRRRRARVAGDNEAETVVARL